MGAVTFNHEVTSDQGLEKVYQDLVRESLTEYGNDPYSGTIATTEGCNLVPTSRYLTPGEAIRLADERIDNLRKWEACEGIGIIKVRPEWQRTVRLKVSVTQTEIGSGNVQTALLAAAQVKVPLRPGEALDSVEIVHEDQQYQRTPQIDYRFKIISVTTEGNKETRYFINTENRGFGNGNDWAKGHKTLADAKKYLSQILNGRQDANLFGRTTETYTITAETRRASGAPLVRMQRVIDRATAEVDITVVTIPANTKRDGWYIYGLGAS